MYSSEFFYGVFYGESFNVGVKWTSTGQWRDVRIWLLDHCKEADYTLAGVTAGKPNYRSVYFKNIDDAMMFKLRWGG